MPASAPDFASDILSSEGPLGAWRDNSMSGVWVFRNGVAKRVANPTVDSIDGDDLFGAAAYPRKELVFTATNESMTSYELLEEKLLYLGWELYEVSGDRRLYQNSSAPHLITLPAAFSDFNTVQMYDIVIKCRSFFQVRDA